MTFPAQAQILRVVHLSSVIPANDTRESVFGHRIFSCREWGSNLGPLASEASALPLSYHAEITISTLIAGYRSVFFSAVFGAEFLAPFPSPKIMFFSPILKENSPQNEVLKKNRQNVTTACRKCV